MPTHEAYERQVQLLVRILPVVAEEEVFALKGGTAINLFVRDLPRLSVDIDLTYLPIEDWATSVARIEAALTRIAGRIRERIPNAQVNLARNAEGQVVKAHVQAGAPVKIEVTPVSRGVVFDAATRTVTPAVVARRQPSKELREFLVEALRVAERTAVLERADRPGLAGPVVDVLEEMAMDRAEMICVKGALGEGFFRPLRD